MITSASSIFSTFAAMAASEYGLVACPSGSKIEDALIAMTYLV
jgi:hypothetical protein